MEYKYFNVLSQCYENIHADLDFYLVNTDNRYLLRIADERVENIQFDWETREEIFYL